MYDPKVGQFLSEDFLGLLDDIHPRWYVKNSPTNYTDPTGLFRVSKDTSVGRGQGNRNPSEKTTEQDNLKGQFWIFEFEAGDNPHVAQQVSVTGTFEVKEKTKGGKIVAHSVSWNETYTEAWARPKDRTISDLHAARVDMQAHYIEAKLNLRFVKQGRGDLILVEKNKPVPRLDECRFVESWSFKMTAQFQLVNGLYPTWTQQFDTVEEPIFVSQPPDFKITNLTLNDQAQQNPNPLDKVFDHALRPGGGELPFNGLPSVGVQKTFNNTTKWDVEWKRGNPYPTIQFDPGDYK